MSERAELGARAEALVARHFEERGFHVEARNWSCKGGELDLVVARDRLVVFVEVRSVSTGWAGSPTLTVGPAKQRRVGRAADLYLRRREAPADTIRFDVVGVRFGLGRPRLEHIENAFVPDWGF